MNRVVRVLLPLLLLLSVCWAGSAEAQRVVEHGEIVIMEGDSALVSGEAGNSVSSFCGVLLKMHQGISSLSPRRPTAAMKMLFVPF